MRIRKTIKNSKYTLNRYVPIYNYICYETFPRLFRITLKKFVTRSIMESIHRKFSKDNIFKLCKEGKLIQFYLPTENDYVQRNIVIRRKFYDNYNLDIIRQIVKPNMVMLDIGANIGNHTIFFGKILDAKKIYAFEPQKDVVEILKYNIQINDLTNTVVVYDCGLGYNNTNATIALDGKVVRRLDEDGKVVKNIGGTMIKEDQKGQLKIRRLDDIKIDQEVDFIKIDVEGMEREVLKGATETIKRNKPIIYIEIFDHHYKEINSILTDYGYVLDRAMVEQNYLFVPI